MARIVVLMVALMLAGCTSPRVVVETQEVRVPVPYRVQPPEDLVRPFAPQRLPQFALPTDTTATSCLTAEGERILRELLIDMKIRIEMWEAWAK